MADHVERVGLVFNEDGSADFVKSLKLVNSNLKENYENYKLVQAQWDKSTSITQKLKDKMVYLNDAYDIQRQKVIVLKTELEELELEENRNEVAISKKKAQLTQAEASLKRYDNQIDETNVKLKTHSEEIKKAGEKVEEYGKKIESAGNKASAFSAATLTAFMAATKGAIDFESDFTGVIKTVEGTDEQLVKIKQEIRDMAKEIPASTKEISGVAEAAGQLGIATDDIMNFTRVMIDLGNSTNLSAEEAATALAKFANVTKMKSEEYSNLGSTIVALGNNFATTEKDIVEMATRLAATGEITGLTQSQILALATAMSSVGIEAEAGGSAMSKLLKQIQNAVENGGEKLKQFSTVAGVTGEEFKQIFEEDAVKALSMFIGGLNDTEKNGKSAIGVLNDMEITEVRLSNTILSLANSNDLMTRAVDLASESWEENNALNKEASKRYDTLKSKMTVSVNKLKDMGITIGNKLMPFVEKSVDKVDEWTKKFDKLDDSQIENIIKIGATVVALGPLLKIIGSVTTGTGKLIKGFGNLKETLGLISLKAGGTGTALSGVSTILSNLVSPAGLATAGLSAMVGTTIYLSEKSKILSGNVKELRDDVDSQRKSWEDLKNKSQEYIDTNSSEIISMEVLRNGLKGIVDENGRVKQGYEERAQYIVGELNSALGTELKINDGIITDYQTIGKEIDNIIEKKKAELLLDAYSEQYTVALKNQAEAVETLRKIQEKMREAEEKLADTHSNLSSKEIMKLRGQYKILSGQLREQMNLTSEYGYTIQNYESLNKAVISGTADEIEVAMEKMNVSFERAKESQGKSLEAQLSAQENYVNQLEELLTKAEENQDENSAYLIQNQLDTAKKQRDNLSEIINGTINQIEFSAEELCSASQNVANNTSQSFDENLRIPEIVDNNITTAEKMISSDGKINAAWIIHTNKANTTVENMLKINEKYSNELNNTNNTISGDTKVVTAVQGMTNEVNSALQRNLDGNKWGQDLIDEMSKGLKNPSKLSGLTSAAAGVAIKIKNILGFSIPKEGPLSDFDKSMPDMIDLMVDGLRKSAPKLENETKNIAKNMENNLERKPQSYINTQQYPDSNTSNGITEDVLYRCIFRAITNCKIKLDESGFIKFIDDRLLEVM